MTHTATEGATAMLADNMKHSFHREGICDHETMQQLLEAEAVDAIMFLALLQGERAYQACLSAPRTSDFRFHQVSTDEVFGDSPLNNAPLTKISLMRPHSASMAAFDPLVMTWHNISGLPVVFSNCSNNYGAHKSPEKLIPLMILNEPKGEPLPVYGTDGNVRDWLRVEDHARTLVLVRTKSRVGEPSNVGGPNEPSKLSVVETNAGLLSELHRLDNSAQCQLICIAGYRLGHDLWFAVEASKIERQPGRGARPPFEAGVRDTVAWSNEKWWRTLRKLRYADQRLGDGK